MKKISLFIIISLFYLGLSAYSEAIAEDPPVSLTKAEILWLSEHPIIRVHNEKDWPPFNFYHNDQPAGYSIDYMNLIAKRLGITVEYISGPSWNEFMDLIRSKDLDVMLNIANTEERREYIHFTEGYFTALNGIYSKESAKAIISLKQIVEQGLNIAVPKGFSNHKLLEKFYPEIKLVLKTDQLSAITAVLAGEADTTIGREGVMNYLLADRMIAGLKLTGLVTDERFKSAINIGVRSDWQILRDIIQKAMKTIPLEDLIKLRRKWALGGEEVQGINLTKKEKAWLAGHPIIRVHNEKDWPPFNFYHNDQPVGYSIDYMNIIAKRLGITVEYITGPSWNEFMDLIRNKDLDVMLNIANTEERREYIHFTEGYFTTLNGIYSKKSDQAIISLEQIVEKRLTIAVPKGFSSHKLLEKFYPEIKLVLKIDQMAAIKAVLTGEADATIGREGVMDYLLADRMIASLKLTDLVTDKRFKSALNIGVRSDWQILRDIIQKAMKTISREELIILRRKWALGSEEVQGLNLTKEEKSWLARHQVVRVGADPAWAPIESLNKDDNYEGLSIDYLKKIEPMLGIRFEFIRENWQELISRAKQKQVDMFTCVASTPEREKYLLFTDPYIQMPAGIFTREEVTYISNLNMIAEKKIAVVEGYATHDYLVDNYPDIDLVLAKNPDEGIQYILEKKALAFIDNTITTGHLLGRKGYLNIKLIGEIPFTYNQSMGVRKDWPQLRAILQKAVNSISSSERNAIYNQWVPVTYEKPVNYSMFWKIGAGLLCIICLSLFWNKKLSTEVKKRTSSLLESQKRFQAVYEKAPIGIAIIDSETSQFLNVNIKYCEIVGYSEDEMLSQNSSNITHPDDLQEDLDNMELLRSGEINDFKMEKRYYTKDGSIVFVLLAVVALWDEDFQHKIHLAIVEDITERKKVAKEMVKLESQLRQTHKMEAIGTLAGGIAHDFNNILAAIVGYAEMVQEELQPGDSAFEMQEQVLKAGLRAKELVQQILLFSRQADQINRPVQPHLIIKEALKLLRASIPATIEIRENIPPDCGSILADATQLHQVIMNLCTNAYHAMRESGGVLSIALSRIEIREEDISFTDLQFAPGEYLKLEVGDNGHGMNQTTLEKIYDPYFTTKPKGEGSGLGLSVVLGIVKSYGGLIKVYSEPDEGTNIQIYFPRFKSSGNTQKPKKERALPQGKERILVVDDDKAILGMMKKSLDSLGYDVFAYTSSHDALESFKADENKYHLVITDMTMPHMTGLELIKQIFAIRPKIPTILCTGFNELVNEEQAIALGIGKFLVKPVLRADMAKAIRQVLDGK